MLAILVCPSVFLPTVILIYFESLQNFWHKLNGLMERQLIFFTLFESRFLNVSSKKQREGQNVSSSSAETY